MSPELEAATAEVVRLLRAARALLPTPEEGETDPGDVAAREVAHRILRALRVDGLGGCRLCCS